MCVCNFIYLYLFYSFLLLYIYTLNNLIFVYILIYIYTCIIYLRGPPNSRSLVVPEPQFKINCNKNNNYIQLYTLYIVQCNYVQFTLYYLHF